MFQLHTVTHDSLPTWLIEVPYSNFTRGKVSDDEKFTEIIKNNKNKSNINFFPTPPPFVNGICTHGAAR